MRFGFQSARPRNSFGLIIQPFPTRIPRLGDITRLPVRRRQRGEHDYDSRCSGFGSRAEGHRHRRKTSITVEPVLPFNPRPNWAALSPTGLIPAMQDGDFAVAESSAICLYLERKQPAPAILPSGERDYSRAMFMDGYSGWVFRSLVHGLFFQKVINPVILKGATDQTVIDNIWR